MMLLIVLALTLAVVAPVLYRQYRAGGPGGGAA